MAINPSTLGLKRLTNQKLFRHPLGLALIIALAVIIWVALAATKLIIDKPLAPEKILSHQLRVNNGQLGKVKTSISQYQKPELAGEIKAGIFSPTPK